MLKFILVVAFVGLASAQLGRPRASAPRTSGNSQDIQIVRSEVENNGDGTYSYRYETSDGTIVEERGSLKPPAPGSDEPIQVAEGSYQYYSPEGELIQLTYRADDGGFQPQGAHLPTPPPIPEAILKSLDPNYRNAAPRQQSRPAPYRQSAGGRPRF